jgi:hypothetical protein
MGIPEGTVGMVVGAEEGVGPEPEVEDGGDGGDEAGSGGEEEDRHGLCGPAKGEQQTCQLCRPSQTLQKYSPCLNL